MKRLFVAVAIGFLCSSAFGDFGDPAQAEEAEEGCATCTTYAADPSFIQPDRRSSPPKKVDTSEKTLRGEVSSFGSLTGARSSIGEAR